MYRGMFFKFACDHKQIYGGSEFSMKAANHERKGLQVSVQRGLLLSQTDDRKTGVDLELSAESALPPDHHV
jgi:hypothetical protein